MKACWSLILALSLCMLVGGGCKGSDKNLKDKVVDVKVGMTLVEVEAILGKGTKIPGTISTRGANVQMDKQIYAWGDEDFINFTATPKESGEIRVQGQGIMILFDDGKVERIMTNRG